MQNNTVQNNTAQNYADVYKAKWTAVDELLRSATISPEIAGASAELNSQQVSSETVFPGVVLLVGAGSEIVYHKAFGCRSLRAEVSSMEIDMVFDVASLTKPLITSTLAMQLVSQNRLSVDQRLSHIFQTFGTLGKERITIKQLLNHTSGYPANAPFYKLIEKADRADRVGVMTSPGAVEIVYNSIYRGALENLPGRVTNYSDIGFILLGHAIEVISGGNRLDKLAQKEICLPLGLRSTAFIDLTTLKRRGYETVSELIVPTRECSWRGRMMLGEVYDNNAWAMGGVSGHSGLFTSARDVHALVAELIKCWHGEGQLVEKEVIRDFWSREIDNSNGQKSLSSWALGWDTAFAKGSQGKYLSREAVGHLDDYGSSVWIEPALQVSIVLLSNQIHMNQPGADIDNFRCLLHDAVMEALGL